ncbi:uncharacterized protein LOC101734677 isoform X3 [Xenopus tropicalis]|uniref:Uncharacterized protein LOC101734677 isoform X3 n=1 Tax=Xenopus tropicalis TaxID=8364 RepID=A0A8J1JQV2_XENTR|nr:uncharacterized protein LOC101734677 isoform X3 [Xenopus tropicalis]
MPFFMYQSCPQAEPAQSVPGPQGERESGTNPAALRYQPSGTDTESAGEEEGPDSFRLHLNGSSSDSAPTDPQQPAQPEGTHREANEGEARPRDCIQTRFNRYKEILSKKWKILIPGGFIVILLVVVVPVSVCFSAIGNLPQNISRELPADSSLLAGDLLWKPCHGIMLNISNQELSWEGSQQHCAKYHAQLLDINFTQAVRDCIVDAEDYWIGQDCDLTNSPTCKAFNKNDGIVPLHPSTERWFICTK